MTDQEKQEMLEYILDALSTEEWPESLSNRFREAMTETISSQTKTLEDTAEVPVITGHAELDQVATMPATRTTAYGMDYVQVPVSLLRSVLKVSNADTDVSMEIKPNVFYVFGEVRSLKLSFAAGRADCANIYSFFFRSPAGEATELTLPDGIAWMNDDELEPEEGTAYEVSVIGDCASYGSWSLATTENL